MEDVRKSFNKVVNEHLAGKSLLFLNILMEKRSKVAHSYSVRRTETAGIFFSPKNIQNSQLSKLLFSARSRMFEERINFWNIKIYIFVVHM